jgi:hypothetical protein
MNYSHMLARVLIYGAAWAVTVLVLIGIGDWADSKAHAGNVYAARLLGTVIWAVIIGVIYW